MEKHRHQDEHPSPPPDCFTLAELETFEQLEGQLLEDVNYYLWVNTVEGEQAPFRFLYYVELIFDSHESLLLTSGEDSVAIRVSDAATLVQNAAELRQLHGKITIQRVNAASFPLWQNAIGKPLAGIRLSRNEAGLYLNDALLLDFGSQGIVVRLGAKEGLELAPF